MQKGAQKEEMGERQGKCALPQHFKCNEVPSDANEPKKISHGETSRFALKKLYLFNQKKKDLLG
jgi:hypothetical protein